MKAPVAMLALLILLPGCMPATRPPDPVALSLYARNLSNQAYAFTVIGSHAPAIIGDAGDEVPRSYGCGWVGRDWRLIVTEGPEPPEPADDFAAETSAEEYPHDSLALWIDVGADGRVTIGDGVPAWWLHEEQRCS